MHLQTLLLTVLQPQKTEILLLLHTPVPSPTPSVNFYMETLTVMAASMQLILLSECTCWELVKNHLIVSGKLGQMLMEMEK